MRSPSVRSSSHTPGVHNVGPRCNRGPQVAEVERFWSHVVKGPGAAHWFFTGAIGDDGYGRFWVSRNGMPRVVRASRYALELASPGVLDSGIFALHDCDEPLCVRAEATSTTHILAGTQAENLAQMGRRGRGGGAWWSRRWTGPTVADRVARSRALREAVRDGWDDGRIRDALAALEVSNQRVLF